MLFCSSFHLASLRCKSDFIIIMQVDCSFLPLRNELLSFIWTLLKSLCDFLIVARVESVIR